LAKRLHADFHEWKEEVKYMPLQCDMFICSIICLYYV
jgi:hypothetical protein